MEKSGELEALRNRYYTVDVIESAADVDIELEVVVVVVERRYNHRNGCRSCYSSVSETGSIQRSVDYDVDLN